MIRFFVSLDIEKFISIKNAEIQNSIQNMCDSTKKPLFLYAYSVFESSITEILRYYLNAFPEKIDKSVNIEKDILLSCPATRDIIAKTINSYIRKYSCETLADYLSFFEKTLTLDLSLDINQIQMISEVRNSITHDGSCSELLLLHVHNCSRPSFPPLPIIQKHMLFFTNTLSNICDQIQKKYAHYTYEALIRNVWNHVFTSPLLAFDAFWEFRQDGVVQIKDTQKLKKRIQNLSSSEHLLLSVFLQQYNNTLNGQLHSFEKIPALVSIDDEGKNSLIELIDFFTYYPLFFNGEKIKTSLP